MEDAGITRGGRGLLYYARVMNANGLMMAAIADEEVYGKAVIDDDTGVAVIVSEEFYGGNVIEEDEAARLLEAADILVLAGRRIISKAVKMGLVNPDSIMEVKGIQHVQVYKFRY